MRAFIQKYWLLGAALAFLLFALLVSFITTFGPWIILWMLASQF